MNIDDILDIHNQKHEENQENEDLDLHKLELQIENEKRSQQVLPYKDFYDIDIYNIENYDRKVVLYNLPYANIDEIHQLVHTFLMTLHTKLSIDNVKQNISKQYVTLIEKHENKEFYYVELSDKTDIERIVLLNNTDWRGKSIKVEKVHIFISKYNKSKGEILKISHEKVNKQTGLIENTNNKIVFSGYPSKSSQDEVKSFLSALGNLKSIKFKERNQRKYCIVEFFDHFEAVFAVKILSRFGRFRVGLYNEDDIQDRLDEYLKHKRKNQIDDKETEGESGNYNSNALKYNNDHDMKIHQNEIYTYPMSYAYIPSRLITMINCLSGLDIYYKEDYDFIYNDIKTEVSKYGKVEFMKIIEMKDNIVTTETGKIYIMFSSIEEAIIAKWRLSGRKYNSRTVVCAFCPEEKYEDVCKL